jgi:AraC family transcriptional regulator, transcriptional activator of the genes for pyochelin and ferripyochelin receptors
MPQSTTIKAEELFGDLFTPDPPQSCVDCFEKCWKWPEEIGKGSLFISQLRPGLILGMGDYQLLEDIDVSFELESSPITLEFSISGNIKQAVDFGKGQNDLWHSKHGHSIITHLPECQGVSKIPAKTHHNSISIHIAPQLLYSFVQEEYNDIPDDLADLISGVIPNVYYQISSTRLPVSTIIQELLNSPFQRSMKRLHFECKTLELILYCLAPLVHPEATPKKNQGLQASDIERIREARHVLVSSLKSPPSLSELATQVGINKNKLNRGFRQVFGTSVFDYLRISRLEMGRELLKSKHTNVTETAFEVGYSQQSNFTKAFKKHFGTNPIEYLR